MDERRPSRLGPAPCPSPRGGSHDPTSGNARSEPLRPGTDLSPSFGVALAPRGQRAVRRRRLGAVSTAGLASTTSARSPDQGSGGAPCGPARGDPAYEPDPDDRRPRPRRTVVGGGRGPGRAIARRLLPLKAVVILREELARRGRNGTGVVQRVFDERLLRGADEDSGLELRLLRIIRRFALPPVTFQHEVWHDGRFVGRIDAAYPSAMVAIEADGFIAHSDFDAFQHDRERQNELTVLGWTVLRFTLPRHRAPPGPCRGRHSLGSVMHRVRLPHRKHHRSGVGRRG